MNMWKGIEQKEIQEGDVVAVVWKNLPEHEKDRGWVEKFNEARDMVYITNTLYEGNKYWVALWKARFVSRPSDSNYDPYKGTKEAGKWSRA